MEPVKLDFVIRGSDFINAGEASSGTKKALTRLGIAPSAIKRAAIAMYEAELNAVIHAGGGRAEVEIYPDHIQIKVIDNGPGIPDVGLAMQEGWSTAPDIAREMGFGAGMGLPNIKKNSDDMNIETKIGQGTALSIVIKF
ncbi:MAG: anti-sigma regulatory factor [Clostridiaceae bacterium]|nr:anti-sigma regulatory factor [Clostridiaceae bacterium]